MAEVESNCKEHVIKDHPDWNFHPDYNEEVGKKSTLPSGSVFTNPGWLQNLQANFNQIIISSCSKRAREAVENNENIKVLEEKNCS